MLRKKPTLIFLIIFFLISSSVSGQSQEVKFLIDTCIKIMQVNAANSNRVNWKKIKQTALAKSKNINDPYQLGPVIRYLYQSVDDFHGSFYYKDSTFHWQKTKSVISDSIMNEWKKRVHIMPLMLGDGVGYLRVPSMPYPDKKDADKHAQMLNDSLCFLLDKQVKGIILDLRLDGGGSMYPMILGLEQLLAPGEIGHFLSKKRINWYLTENNFLLDSNVMASIFPKCTTNAQHIPVVVLIGPGTASSGEFLTMAFKPRKKTLFLGTETAGYVTSNAGFPINDAAFVLLATGYGADREGRIYKKAIRPDIHMEAVDKFNNVEMDEKVQAAINWLKQNSN